MSQANLAANLHGLAHNGSAGHGGFFNDLDLLQVGWGDFARPEDLDKVVAHLTMHVLLKSPLLISTYVSELSEEAGRAPRARRGAGGRAAGPRRDAAGEAHACIGL